MRSASLVTRRSAPPVHQTLLFDPTPSSASWPALSESGETPREVDDYCVALYRAGLTMAEIGRRLGVSRERVRQRLRRAEGRGAALTREERRGPHGIDPQAIVALVRRDGSTESWSDVARRLHRAESALRRSAAAVGVYELIDRLLRLRRRARRTRRAWSPERVLREVARVARGRQRTPSSVELMREHPALFSALYKFFASYHDVCVLAGLTPLRARIGSGRAGRYGEPAEPDQAVPARPR